MSLRKRQRDYRHWLAQEKLNYLMRRPLRIGEEVTDEEVIAAIKSVPTHFAWSLTAHTGGIASNLSGGTTTPNVNATGGTFGVAVVSWFNGGNTPGLDDSHSDPYTSLVTASGGNASCTIFYRLNPTVSSTYNWTLTGNPTFFSVACAVFSGGGTAADQSTGAGSNSATSEASGSITPTQGGELCITGCAYVPNPGPLTSTNSGAPTGYTLTDNFYDSSGNDISAAMAYLAQGSAAATNPNWVGTGTAGRFVAVVASFKNGVAAGYNPYDIPHSPQHQAMVAM